MLNRTKAIILAFVVIKVLIIVDLISQWQQNKAIYYGVMLVSLSLLFYAVYKLK